METVRLGAVSVRYVHGEDAGPYALLEWIAPAGAPAPPAHVHHRTDEGFYVLAGTFTFTIDGDEIDGSPGSHVLVRRGQAHTFWNSGGGTARCLIVISPAGFAGYFRELAAGLAASDSADAPIEVRRALSARFDIEVV